MANKKLMLGDIVNNDNLNVSIEMIDPQIDDSVVVELQEQFNNLILLIADEDIKDTYQLFKNKSGLNIVNLIDSLTSNRFGINFKHLATNSNNYGVLTTPPINYNVLNNDAEMKYHDAKEWIKIFDVGTSSKDNLDNVDSDKDFVKIVSNWANSFKSLDDQLKESTIVIDNKKAKIHGLPKTYNIAILGDLVFLIRDIKLNSKELVAVLLHEVGHAYTHIEYSYRTVNSTMVLVDTIKDTMLKSNGGLKKALKLGYEKAFNEKMVSKSDTEVEAVINIANKYLNSTRYISKQYHSYTDSEQIADQFSSRFGLGNELATGLTKMIGYNTELRKLNCITLSLLPVAIIFSIAAMSLLLGVAYLVIGVIVVYIFELIGDIIDSIATAGGSKRAVTYDDNKRRIIRIRNELVRTIRLVDVDKKTMTLLIENVEEINKLLNTIPDDKVGIIDSFFRRLSGVSDEAINSKLLEQMLEDVGENSLHIMSQKFKNL